MIRFILDLFKVIHNFLLRHCLLFAVHAESYGEPKDNLADGNNAESQTEAEESTKVGDEVKDRQPL